MARVSIQNLTKKYGATIAVDDFSLDVKDGEFLTLLGPSGCGKTTILRCIAGFIPITKGKIYIGDKLVSCDKPKVSIAPEYRNIGMVFQCYALWPHMNVYNNIVYPLKVRAIPEREIKKRAEGIIGILKLTGYEDRYPSELSGGQQQRVALGRAIIMEPDVLLMDEPLSNLDAKLREEMRFELKDLQKKTGTTIIYVTHDQIEAITMSERVVVLSDGKVQQIGSPIEVYERPVNRFVASFIGKTNFLNGKVIDISNDIVRIRIENSQTLKLEKKKLENKEPLLRNDKIILMIRPHNIEITKTKRQNSVETRVRSSIYMGDRRTTILNFNNKEIMVETPPEILLKNNEQVYLSFKKIAVIKS